MASKNSYATSGGGQSDARTNSDNARWIGGLLLLFIGIFAFSALFFSFFTWAADQSGLQLSAEERTTLGVEPDNLCGWAGARLAILLVDRSFGVFGILIPVILILTGMRIIRRQALRANHSILSLVLVMILGSLTLGFAFADSWSLCCSTGWGGAFGIEIAALLNDYIGAFGMLILLLGGWILTGVFINRNFINTVNTAGNVMVDKGEKIVEIVCQKVAPGMRPDEPAVLAEEARSVEPAPASKNPGRSEAQRPADPKAVEALNLSKNAIPETPAQPAEPEENPFLDRSPEESSADMEVERTEVRPETVREEPAVFEAEDEEFIEVDLSQPAGRIVMGAGGLVELDRSATVDAEPQRRSVPVSQEHEPAVRRYETDGPFTEIDLSEPADSKDDGIRESDVIEEVADASAAAVSEPMPIVPEDEPEGVVVTVESHQARMVDEKSIPTESYDPLKDLVNYRKPPVTLLEDYISDSEVSDEEIYDNKSRIEETLKNFGIPIQRIKATVGPTVTLYEIVQAQGVKIAKIQGLQNDIAQSLKAESGIRIIAPIPGRGTIGIEVPNRNKQVVSMYSAVRSLRFQESKAALPVVIGRTIQNENYVFDLAKMPHLLVAGATGQGKSVGLNAIITSLLYRKHPAQLKFVMIDPKMVEFSLYAKIERHFLAKMESEDDAIITDPKKAVYTLNSLCVEMDNRLELCKKAGSRNIIEYNEKFTSRRLNPMHGHRYLPYMVVVIDEFADLIMMAKEVEAPVIRLAQKARAVGIHLIIATQRPSVDVITGKIKANFPARIAFRVMQMIDSRTIIDRPGANELIGRGDMLISKDGELTRVQCAFVDTPEVERIVDYISKQQGYTSPYALPDYTPESGEGGSGLGSEESSAPVKYDTLFAEIAREAVSSGQISTSMIQRNYEVGFNRAGRIMLQLERAGIVGRQQGAKPREILFHDSPSLEAKLQDLGVF